MPGTSGGCVIAPQLLLQHPGRGAPGQKIKAEDLLLPRGFQDSLASVPGKFLLDSSTLSHPPETLFTLCIVLLGRSWRFTENGHGKETLYQL